MSPTRIITPSADTTLERLHFYELHVEEVVVHIANLGLRLRLVRLLVLMDGKPLLYQCFYVRSTPHVVEVFEETAVVVAA